MRKGIGILLILMLIWLPQTVMAADNEKTGNGFATFALGDIVVSAEQETSYQTTAIDVFTEEDIKAAGAYTLAEALEFMPGIVVSYGNKNQPRVHMNGYDDSQILVLVDGVPFYETGYRTLDMNQIPSAAISRIEVIKGAASVLYGPNAMGGVINVVTKKGGVEPTVTAYAEVGPHKMKNYGAALGGSYGLVNGWLSVDHREGDGWDVSDRYKPKADSGVTLQDNGMRLNSDWKTTSVWARLGVEPMQNSEYYASFHYVTKDGGIPFAVDSLKNVSVNRWDLYEEIGMDLSGKQQLFNGFVLTGKLFYHQHEDKYETWDYAVFGDELVWDFTLDETSHYKDRMLGGQVIADWEINDMHTLRASAQYRQDVHKQTKNMDTEPMDSYTSYTGSIGLEYQLSLLDKHLGIVIGASYDWFDISKGKKYNYKTGNFDYPALGSTTDTFNPMIGINFLVPKDYGWLADTEFYVSVAKKTGFPSLRQQASATGANPNLKAQEGINYTVGANREFWDGMLAFSGSIFYNDVKNWIEKESTGPKTFIYKNIAKRQFYGFQLGLAFKPLDCLTLSVDYTYTDGKDKTNDRLTNHTTGLYKHKLGLGLGWVIAPEYNTKLDLRGVWVGTSYEAVPLANDTKYQEFIKTEPYFLLNARLSTNVFSDNFEIYGMVYNVFDADYEYEAGYTAKGRTFILGTRVTF